MVRKCGRVVCGSCSPHRITIPYQYIVQPPGMPRLPVPRYPSAPLGSDGSFIDFGAMGGGERVRLCNPCVPDPNIAPPQTQGGHSRSQSTMEGPATENPQTGRGWGSYFGAGPTVTEAHVRSRSVTMVCSHDGPLRRFQCCISAPLIHALPHATFSTTCN